MARVLVVEDDPTVAKAVTACLQLDQHEVRTATDLPSGVEQLRQAPADLILTDLFVHTFSSEAFADLAPLAEVAPSTPIVVTTAHPQAAAHDPALYGFAGIILKPFAPHDLRAFVQALLAEQRQRLSSLEAHAEQAWDQIRSAQQHIGESRELLRRVEPPAQPLPPDAA